MKHILSALNRMELPDIEAPNLSKNQYIGSFMRKYKRGEVLFSDGDYGHEMFIVMKGEVTVNKIVNNQVIPLAVFRSGNFFGEMALVDDGIRAGSAVITEDDTHLILINKARFVYLVSQQPAFALSIMRTMSQRLKLSNTHNNGTA